MIFDSGDLNGRPTSESQDRTAAHRLLRLRNGTH